MSEKRAIQHVETEYSCDKNVFDTIKGTPPENCTSTESQAFPCCLGKLQFRGGINSERSTLVQLFSGTMHVLPQWRRHVAESPHWGELGRGCPSGLTDCVPVECSAVFWDSVPDLSVLGECFGCWGFLPSEFGCKCNFCEISHGLSSYAKWPETAASSPAVNFFQN